MNDALVFEKKYVSAEAKNTISYAKMMIIRVAASALPYFCAETSASFISRCEDNCTYLPREQRTSIRKVSLYQKLHHFLIVLQRRVSATTKPKDFVFVVP